MKRVKRLEPHVRKEPFRNRRALSVDVPARAIVNTRRHAQRPARARALLALDERRRALSRATAGRERERADVADARAKHDEREPEAYGPVGRDLEVREQEREQGRVRLGLAQQSLRERRPIFCTLRIASTCAANAGSIAPTAKVISSTTSFSRPRCAASVAAIAAFAAHPAAEELHPR
jgi:hypothetical protein